jgi:hypothetical protein
MKLALIALFVYNRPWHTKKTIEALQKNTLAPDSDLIIFSDGPKEFPDSQGKVSAVREYLKTINGFRSIKIIEREKNIGLAKSVISGVDSVLSKNDRIIVLEDDMVSSRYFLKYMNEALDIYEKEDRVISVHAYIYPIRKKLPETFFLRGADCWGWGTWRRGWDLFESDGGKLLKELEGRKLTKEFDFSGSYRYTQMLKDQISGKNDSWAIRWYASAFLNNKLTLYPGKSLINNIGFDGSGVHCVNNNSGNLEQVENAKIEVKKIEIKEDFEARLAVIDYFRSQLNLWSRSLSWLKNILKF